MKNINVTDLFIIVNVIQLIHLPRRGGHIVRPLSVQKDLQSDFYSNSVIIKDS